MPAFPSLARVATLTCSLALVTGTSRDASAQTLGGQVVQLDTKKPLSGAAVALVNDSAQIVASSSASPDGAFYLDAPRPGGYRLVLFVAGASFVSPSVQLDSGRTVEKLFSVPDVPETFATTLFARDVTSEATRIPGSPAPAYPPGMVEEGIRGTVSVMFVVGETGLPELATLRVLNATSERFAASVRDALVRTRFVPAQKDGDPVRQVVQYTYDFGLAGDPPRGDVLVRPIVPVVQVERKPPVKTMYVITSDELSAPDVEQMNLVDALHKLRPRLYGPSRSTTVTSPSEPPVFVNGVRVEGMASLRNISANQVEQVRYWKREEAAMQFGMEYPYAVTVKLRPDRS
jgi:TonB family protein